MKSKNFIILSITAFIFLFQSCETYIDFNGEETTPMLVVNSFCTPDSIITVNVSKSKFFLEENFKFDFVNNAEVHLWVNGQLKEKLISAGNGNYKALYKPKIGDIIKITAKNPVFSEVEGLVEVPSAVAIQKVDTTTNKLESTPLLNYVYLPNNTYKKDTIGFIHNIKLNFGIKFSDPPAQNYYRLVVKQRQYFEDGTIIENPFYFNSDDVVFGSVSVGNIFNEKSYSYYFEFSDELFDGKNYNLKFYCNFYQYEYFDNEFSGKIVKPGGETSEKSELLIDLQSISKSYYFYIKTLVANSSVTELFSEPVQIYSNVKGGIGVIGSYTPSVYKFEIPFFEGLNSR